MAAKSSKDLKNKLDLKNIAEPGDKIAFHRPGGYVHYGIYAGDYTIIHVSGAENRGSVPTKAGSEVIASDFEQ
ncbi:unnamed protein product, partial [Rotaria sordida]